MIRKRPGMSPLSLVAPRALLKLHQGKTQHELHKPVLLPSCVPTTLGHIVWQTHQVQIHLYTVESEHEEKLLQTQGAYA